MKLHRFEPARLLLGLLLVGAALTYVMHALGEWRVPVWVLLVLVPASLSLAAFTAGATFAVRRLLRRRRAHAPRPLGGMPMDELRGGYGSPGRGSGASGGAEPGGSGAGEAGSREAETREAGTREGPGTGTGPRSGSSSDSGTGTGTDSGSGSGPGTGTGPGTGKG